MYNCNKLILYIYGCATNFLAGDALRSSKRYQALDETALFGCACRHEFPKLFINLKHGERYHRIMKVMDSLYIALQTMLIPQTILWSLVTPGNVTADSS